MLCAKGVVQDAYTRNISVYSILDIISAASFPLYVQEMGVLCILHRRKRDKSQIELELKVLLDGKQLNAFKLKTDFQKSMKNNQIVTLKGITIPSPGILEFVMYYGDRKLKTYEIRVRQIGKAKIVKHPRRE